MSLFDPNAIAIKEDLNFKDDGSQTPGSTGEAMAPHDPANVLESNDDNIEIDNLLDDGDTVGSDNIFGIGAVASDTASAEALAIKQVQEQEANLNNFFASVEMFAHGETGVNPELHSSTFNPQMAVIPLDDPAIAKTSNDIKDVNGAHIEDDIFQQTTVSAVGIEDISQLISDIRSISTESLLPLSTDGVTYAEIMADNQYVDTYVGAMKNAVIGIESILASIEEVGGIDKSMVLSLENIQPGIITKHVSLESFTSYPTKTNLVASLEATDHWVVGAKVVGGAVIFGLIVKMLLWIKEKLGGGIEVSAEVIDSANARKNQIIKDINDIATSQIDVIRTSPTIVKNINAKCNELLRTNKYSVKVDNIAEANNVFLQQYTHREFPKYSKLHDMIINNKGVNAGLDKVTKFLADKLHELEVKFTNYESKYRDASLMDPVQFKTDWTDALSITKELGFVDKPKNIYALGEHMRSTITTLSKTHAPIPTYDTLKNGHYSPGSAADFKNVEKEVGALLSKVVKLSKEHTTFPDKQIGGNREEIGNILKSEVNNLMGFVVAVLSIRNTGNSIHKRLINVVKNVDDAWKWVFKGSPIKYGTGK